MAQEHGVRFIPHGWNTAVGLAADLQLASAFPDTDLVEYLTGSPFIDDLVAKSGSWTPMECFPFLTLRDSGIDLSLGRISRIFTVPAESG